MRPRPVVDRRRNRLLSVVIACSVLTALGVLLPPWLSNVVPEEKRVLGGWNHYLFDPVTGLDGDFKGPWVMAMVLLGGIAAWLVRTGMPTNPPPLNARTLMVFSAALFAASSFLVVTDLLRPTETFPGTDRYAGFVEDRYNTLWIWFTLATCAAGALAAFSAARRPPSVTSVSEVFR